MTWQDDEEDISRNEDEEYEDDQDRATKEATQSTYSRTEDSGSIWTSWMTILFFLLLLPTGLILTSVSSGLAGLQDVTFGLGILFWVVGIFGGVYCIVRRCAGPKVAALAVVVLFVILLSEIFSGNRRDRKDLLKKHRRSVS